MKNALIIGSPDSIHSKNFIESILINNKTVNKIDFFSIDYDCDIKAEYKEYYKENNVHIICMESKKYKINAINKIEYISKKTKCLRNLLKDNEYDYCFVLYCGKYNAMWSSLFVKKFKKLIPVFWGGDVLRNNHLENYFYKKMLNSSYEIVMPNENSLRIFNEKTEHKYSNKTVVIQYPQKMIPSLMGSELNLNINACKEKFNLPLNKKIVICGHTATRAENYLEVIEALQKCDSKVLEECYFVFMMTYAPEEYFKYQQEVEELLFESKLNGIVLKNFIPYDDILSLHYASDIHITAIKTDALSCFLQEELFSGSILLYGKWLNYYEIENKAFFAISFDSIPDLTNEFSRTILNYTEYKERAKCNRKGIINLASEEAILKEWNKEVFNK